MKDQTPEVVTGPALLVRFPWLKYPEIDVSQSENKISSTSKHRLKSKLKPKKTMAFNTDCFEKQYKELCNLKNKRRIAIELCSLEQFRVMSDREKQGYLASRCVHKLTRMDEGEARTAIHEIITLERSKMKLCFELGYRKGYRALGYKNFKDCVDAELKGVIKYDMAHKLKMAGEVHISLFPQLEMGHIPEGVLRALHSYPVEERKMIWDSATNSNNFDNSGEYQMATIANIQTAIRRHEEDKQPESDRYQDAVRSLPERKFFRPSKNTIEHFRKSCRLFVQGFEEHSAQYDMHKDEMEECLKQSANEFTRQMRIYIVDLAKKKQAPPEMPKRPG